MHMVEALWGPRSGEADTLHRKRGGGRRNNFFFFFKIYLLSKYTVAVFRFIRRGRQISLWMVVNHHVVAGT